MEDKSEEAYFPNSELALFCFEIELKFRQALYHFSDVVFVLLPIG